jgi:LPS-assembly protein
MRITKIIGLLAIMPGLLFAAPGNDPATCLTTKLPISNQTLAGATIAQQLGWVESNENRCGGYYNEPAFASSNDLTKKNLIEYTNTGPTLFSLHGTSVLEGNITVTQTGQQVTANKAYLYRDPITGKISAIDLIGHVHLREPNSLIVAQKGHLNLESKSQTLNNILYRTTIYGQTKQKPQKLENEELLKTHKITQLSAWGEADAFSKTEPKVYEFDQATYSTCPPMSNAWRVKASHLKLNKNTGRGTATNARLYVKSVPVFYSPYLNFAIDNRRQTGFLHPFFGSDNVSGFSLGTPFYWNIAPNYDDTITPVFFSKRGVQANDLFRYMTPIDHGNVKLSVIPNDKQFTHFQTTSQEALGNNPSPTVQANLSRLEHAGDTRGSFAWQDNARYNEHWSTNVDYNSVSDDYYLQDFGHNLDEKTTNQLIQQGDMNYKGRRWNFTGRVQQYQTLHPVDSETPFANQYIRLPQLVLAGDYPDQPGGLDYFVNNEATSFNIRKMPGSTLASPIGNRLYTQPGISLPLNWPYLYVTPRAQFSLSQYQLKDVSDVMPAHSTRTIPILDISSGLYFDRDVSFFGHDLQQTLEPQLYYVYVPYHNQDRFPVFDTTQNTLTYAQLFTYNRFSGLDRIGDANQISLGVTTRFLDSQAGDERIMMGVGQIIYFANRNVTICTVDTPNCLPPVAQEENTERRSPLAGVVNYHLNPAWSLIGNSTWNTQTNNMDNQSVVLAYTPSPQHIVNLGYNFVRNGDQQPAPVPPNSPSNNLKQTSLSFAWPVFQNWSFMGQWIQSINRSRFQNLLYGLQYDSCCWAVRFVAGRNFINNDLNGQPMYDNQVYMQFALRGLGNVGSADPSKVLSSSIGGYNPTFGQNF